MVTSYAFDSTHQLRLRLNIAIYFHEGFENFREADELLENIVNAIKSIFGSIHERTVSALVYALLNWGERYHTDARYREGL